MDRRRRVLGALTLSLLANTSPAHAQARVHRIGYLSLRKTYGELDAAFVFGMQELGYVRGRNLLIEFR